MPGHDSNWHGAHSKARSGARQILRGGRRQSPFVSAPGQVQSGQIGQKIILSLEIADYTVKLSHFGVVVDLFLFALAEEVRRVLDQFLLPITLKTAVDFASADFL